ncbi:hypothetical protein [uncultured Desulfobacter sp.]|uniref:hypothetical protein n=1 Tax=uncultured Desulfobacter sp. TaxID=240139 RepID=UPI0029F4A987|nr:hypothetical protein [uncultured Desulfobacter sp.]
MGLLPLMLESSEQAQFLIPAAVSMTFGLMSSTFITLLLFPVLLCLSMVKHEKRKEPTRVIDCSHS